MSRESTLYVVRGFLDSDWIPDHLKVKSPYHRLAVVTPTYDPSTDGHFRIDAELVTSICKSLCDGFDVQVTFFYESRVFTRLDEKEFRAAVAEDLFQVLTATGRDGVRLQIWGAPWYRVGGPEPYHDSATLEVFCSATESAQILVTIEECLKNQGLSWTTIVGNEVARPRFSFLAWLSKLLRS